ncbi:MAG: hypothetical protein ACK5AK_09615 [Gemmatimonas sp.]|jgi:ligand-binding sensor domain-containing protein
MRRRLPRGLSAVSSIAVASTVLAAACAPVVPGGTGGLGAAREGPYAGSQREERQRIGSFSTVQAVAVSRRYVYAASSGGIAIYDRFTERWLPPLTRDLGIADQQVTVMAGDPVEDALWLGVPGGVITYRPLTEHVQRTIVMGVPQVIAFDRSGAGDALVRSAGQWTRVSRAGITTPVNGAPIAAQTLVPRSFEDLLQQFPMLRTQPQLLLRSAAGNRQQANRPLRQFAVISGAASPDRTSEVWLGTDGDGVYQYDPSFLSGKALPYGLLEPGVGALAPAADGVWAAGLGASERRGGLTFATNDLQRWRWIEGTLAVPLTGVRTFAMATRANRAWLGTDRGLIRVRLDGDNDVQSWSNLDGLADARVLAVAPRGEGVWAGTARGLLYVNDTSDTKAPRTRGIGARLLDNLVINALQFTGDTLWVGSDAGLLAIPSPNTAVGGPVSRPLGNDPALRRPVRSLAWSDSVLLALTDDAVLQLAPHGGVEPARVPALDVLQIGRPLRVAIDDRAMWAAGSDGVIMVSRRTGAVRVLRVGGDLPGPALDLVAQRDWLFVGTPQGLMRFRRGADGLVL